MHACRCKHLHSFKYIIDISKGPRNTSGMVVDADGMMKIELPTRHIFIKNLETCVYYFLFRGSSVAELALICFVTCKVVDNCFTDGKKMAKLPNLSSIFNRKTMLLATTVFDGLLSKRIGCLLSIPLCNRPLMPGLHASDRIM